MKQMEETDELLQRWRAQPPCMVELLSLKTDPALQPRAASCVSFARQATVEAQSADHIRCMAHQMKANGADPEPVLAAQLAQGLFILDGHHRLAACKLAGKATIPARVLEVERHAAVLASKVVNYGGEKLRLHGDQRADAAWQTITALTDRGRRKLPKGTSQRSLGDRFGVSLGTVNRMLDRLGQRAIDPDNYDHDHCDPGTDWPRWRYARNVTYGTDRFQVPAHARLQKAAAGLARKIAEFHAKEGSEGVALVVAMLREQGMDAEALGDLEDFAGHLEDENEHADY